jgi:hypothetical protein
LSRPKGLGLALAHFLPQPVALLGLGALSRHGRMLRQPGIRVWERAFPLFELQRRLPSDERHSGQMERHQASAWGTRQKPELDTCRQQFIADLPLDPARSAAVGFKFDPDGFPVPDYGPVRDSCARPTKFCQVTRPCGTRRVFQRSGKTPGREVTFQQLGNTRLHALLTAQNRRRCTAVLIRSAFAAEPAALSVIVMVMMRMMGVAVSAAIERLRRRHGRAFWKCTGDRRHHSGTLNTRPGAGPGV